MNSQQPIIKAIAKSFAPLSRSFNTSASLFRLPRSEATKEMLNEVSLMFPAYRIHPAVREKFFQVYENTELLFHPGDVSNILKRVLAALENPEEKEIAEKIVTYALLESRPECWTKNLNEASEQTIRYLLSIMIKNKEHLEEVNKIAASKMVNHLLTKSCNSIEDFEVIFNEFKDYVEPSNIAIGLVYSRVHQAKGFEGADEFLKIASEKYNCPITLTTYSHIIRSAANEGNVDLINENLEKARALGPPNYRIVHSALLGYGRAGNADLAEKLFDEALSIGVELFEVEYKFLLNAYSKAGQAEKMEAHLEKMREKNFDIDYLSSAIIIKGYGNAKDYEKAHRFFMSLPNHTVSTMNAYLYALVKCEKLEGLISTYKSVKGRLHPNITTYNLLIEGLEKSGDQEAVDAIKSERDDYIVKRDASIAAKANAEGASNNNYEVNFDINAALEA